jgi:hypothetical protein
MQMSRSVALAACAAALAMSGCSSPGGGPAATGVPGAPRAGVDGAAPHVAVTGWLEGVGGPAPGAPRRWPGTVSWTGSTQGTVRIGAGGRFVLSLPAGRYRLTGHSPRYGGGNYVCRAPHALVVRTGAVVHLDVLCQMR